MELMNLAWHVAALVFGVWGLWLGLESARERALLHDVVLPLLLNGADSRSRSRFVRSIRYLVSCEMPSPFRGKVIVDLRNIGGVDGMTLGWEAHQFRQLFLLFKACRELESPNGLKEVGASRVVTPEQEDSNFLSSPGVRVGFEEAARILVARLRARSSICLRLRAQPAVQGASTGSASRSGVYWELTED